ncbi:MAG: type II secretion system protein GspD, partial [Deltaproteobacteria bacterium]|nr:type II secretion system protein GspD [Deltaproteobacteria bacterium]
MTAKRIFLPVMIAVLGGFLSAWIESPLFAQAASPQGEEAAIPLPQITSSETVVTFDYPDADLADIVAAISKLTGKNFILDQNVKGKISIISPSPVTVEEAYRAFLSALAINKFSIVPSGKYLKIVRQRDATTDSIQTFTGDYTPVIDNFVTQIIQLKYINAEEVRRTFRDLTTREAQLIAYT